MKVAMPGAEASLPSTAIGRLVRLSRVMEMVTWFGIALVAILTIAALLIPDWTRNIALAKLGQAGAALPITPLGQAVAGIVLAIPVGVMIYGLFAVRRMFGEFAGGEIFSERAARHLQTFAATVLAQAPLGPLTAAGFSAALSLGNPPGQARSRSRSRSMIISRWSSAACCSPRPRSCVRPRVSRTRTRVSCEPEWYGDARKRISIDDRFAACPSTPILIEVSCLSSSISM
jgi:hypothetical protein